MSSSESDHLKKVAILGASGRMGHFLISAVLAQPETELVAAIASPNSADLGRDVGTMIGGPKVGIPVISSLTGFSDADVVIDFSVPEASAVMAETAAQTHTPHIIGTTGLTPAHNARIRAAAQTNAIVYAANYSVGITLLTHLTEKVAAALNSEFDIEVVEMHHKHKIDAPSGTAMSLGQAAARGRKVPLETHSIFSRSGHTGARPAGAIGFSSIRGGAVIGDHTVMFAGAQERIELTHKAQDRHIFANGALRAALWAVDQKPGLYTMTDVLGLSDM